MNTVSDKRFEISDGSMSGIVTKIKMMDFLRFMYLFFAAKVKKYGIMKKSLIVISSLMVCTLFMVCQTANADALYGYSLLKGEGTKKTPYLIESKDDLVLFRDLVNGGLDFNGKYVKQTADIDLNGENWLPIGVVLGEHYFYGTYNGNGHIINNLYINEPDQQEYMYGGLFGMLGGTVENLGIENGDINGHCIGGITSHGVGSPIIVNCYYKGKLTATERAGGIADNVGGIIANCYFEGEINAPEAYGIDSYQAGQIINCAYDGDYACCTELTTKAENNIQYYELSAEITQFLNKNNAKLMDGKFEGHYFNLWEFDDNGRICLSNSTVSMDNIVWIILIMGFYMVFVAIFLLAELIRTKRKHQTKKQRLASSDE